MSTFVRPRRPASSGFLGEERLWITLPTAPPDDRRQPASGHNCCTAQPPTNSACPVERAGLTEVLVTGIEIRWISVSAKSIAIGAKPAGTRLGRPQDDQGGRRR